MKSTTILLIEENSSLDSILRDLLSLNNYSFIACTDLDYLDNLVKTAHVDLVIADAELVGIDGFRLKSILNNDSNRVPIIYLSTMTLRNTLLSNEIGAVSFLSMPFTQEQLIGQIKKAISYKQLIASNPESLKPIARLYIEQHEYTTIELLMSRSYTVGRYRNGDVVRSDIRLMSPSASRKHGIFCRVYDGDSSYYKIVDYSQNGIRVNEKRILGYHSLEHGDRIQFPGCNMLYELVDKNVDTNLLDTTYTSEDEAK